MALFHYKALTVEGTVVEGVLEASDEQTVVSRLEEEGQLALKVQSDKGNNFLNQEIQFPWRKKKISREDLLIFTQELSTLIQAGLTLDRSLSILADQNKNTYMGEIVRRLLEGLKSGKALSEALGIYPDIFPKVYVGMVKAGEVGSALDNILLRLAEYLEDVQKLRNYLISALIYPAILTFVAAVSIIIMVLFVIPKFAVIFSNAGAPIPLPMKMLLGISTVLIEYWWLILMVGVAVWIWIKNRLSKKETQLKWDGWLLKWPLLGDILQKIEISRFSRSMGTLLKSSVPLIPSINIVKEIIGNRAIASSMEPIKSGVKKGEGLSNPIRQSGIFPFFALQLLEVGEETGRLDDMLLQIADTYDRELQVKMERLVSLFEPMIILVMGTVIGVIVVSMLYSILSINDVPL